MTFNQEAYLAKYTRLMAKAKAITLNDNNSLDEFTLNINPRVTIQAPPGKVLVSADYSAQEAFDYNKLVIHGLS